MIRAEFEWLLHHVTLYRWYFFALFLAGVLIRWAQPATPGVPFWHWLRLRGRNIVLMYGMRPVSIKIQAVFVSVLAPALTERGFLHHVALPSLWQTVVGVLLLDLSFYGKHRLDHSIPVLWRFHRVHHSDPDIDVTTAALSHPLTGPMRTVWQGITIAALGISTPAAVTYLWLEGYLSYLQHTGLRVEPVDRLFRRSGVVSPVDHQTHHARDLPETNSNFGIIFNIWDRVFGTYRHVPASQIHCGLAEFDEPESQTLLALLISPFRNPKRIGHERQQ